MNVIDVNRVTIVLKGKYPRQKAVEARPVR